MQVENLIEGDFIIAQFLPMGNAISGYATKEWSNETFANNLHAHGYSSSAHKHDSVHSGSNHTHNYATSAPTRANKTSTGSFKLGELPTGTDVKPALSSGQLYWCTTTKMLLVGK